VPPYGYDKWCRRANRSMHILCAGGGRQRVNYLDARATFIGRHQSSGGSDGHASFVARPGAPVHRPPPRMLAPSYADAVDSNKPRTALENSVCCHISVIKRPHNTQAKLDLAATGQNITRPPTIQTTQWAGLF